MSALFLLLLVLNVFFLLKNMREKSLPLYMFASAATLVVWVLVAGRAATAQVMSLLVLIFVGALIYFIMDTKPYENEKEK